MSKTSLAIVVGLGLALGTLAVAWSPPAGADVVVVTSGWRFTDGYWNYYDADDRVWYFTDGRYWYFWADNAWKLYTFDRQFGRKGFVVEGYVVPEAGVDIVLPRHRVWLPPKI